MKRIMAIMAVLLVSLVLLGCEPAEEPAAPAAPAAPAEEPTPAPTTPSVSGAMLSDVACVGDNIQGIITNVLSEDLSLSNIRVIFNGVVVQAEELRCDKTSLSPGESTLCESLQGIRPIKSANAVSVVMGSETAKETISC